MNPELIALLRAALGLPSMRPRENPGMTASPPPVFQPAAAMGMQPHPFMGAGQMAPAPIYQGGGAGGPSPALMTGGRNIPPSAPPVAPPHGPVVEDPNAQLGANAHLGWGEAPPFDYHTALATRPRGTAGPSGVGSHVMHKAAGNRGLTDRGTSKPRPSVGNRGLTDRGTRRPRPPAMPFNRNAMPQPGRPR
jgi:hypothetical protein